MKVKILITKEVLRQSMYCPIPNGTLTSFELDGQMDYLKHNCAVAIAIKDLFPNAAVYQSCVHLLGTLESDSRVNFECITMQYIKSFDEVNDPIERLELPEHSFSIDIPDSVINRIGLDEVNEILSKSETLERV